MSALELTELSGDELRLADELLDRANHDVAKHMAMTARNVNMENIDDELAQMIRRDVTTTNGTEASWSLWRALSSRLIELAPDGAVRKIDQQMDALESLVNRWGDADHLSTDVAEAALNVSDDIRSLRQAVRTRLMEQTH